MKKIGVIAGMIFAAAFVLATPAKVKAEGMPCTEATLKEFQANLQVAQQELANAQAAKAQADANVVALKAQGVTGLELLIATDAATNAANVVSSYQHKVNCAKQSVDNITSRGATEQYYLDMEEKWRNRSSLDAIKVQLDGQNQITSAALTKVKTLQSELLKQQNNFAANPSFAASVDAVQAQLTAAEADYAAQQAKSDALAASYAQALGVPNYATDADNAAYDAFVRNYALSLRKEHVYSSVNDKGEEVDKTILYFDDLNGNQTPSWKYGVPEQPNEWAIRWFE